jgi:hypothetical protein
MGRELRKVPADWVHPKKSNGSYHPMHNIFYGDALQEWISNNEQWSNGTHKDLIARPELKEKYPFYAMWSGGPPDIDYYQTRKWGDEELTHIQLYESTSEGTPLSPVFRSDQLEELCEWASVNVSTFADFKASKEEWLKMLTDGFVFHKQGNAIFI